MKQTILTITGPTASGKSFLLNQLENNKLITKIISITTRKPRNGEVDGKDYYFVTKEQYERYRDRRELVEDVEFNGVLYGTTFNELNEKSKSDLPMAIILEPYGVDTYEKIASTHNWEFKSVFVYSQLKLRKNRIINRIVDDINDNSDILKVLNTHFNRITELENEKYWIVSRDWDLIVPGNDLSLACDMIKKMLTIYYR